MNSMKATGLISWLEKPGILLLLSGVLVGTGFPLAKAASQVQIPATAWVMLNSIGGVISLLPILIAKRQLRFPKARQLRYVLIAGPLTFAAPSLLVFFIVRHVGAGFGGMMFALSPVFTVTFARFFGLDKFNQRKLLGLLLGLVGAIGISLSRGGVSGSLPLIWFFLPLSIPLILAAGNIYRTMDWPQNSSPEFLAFWSHLAACSIYLSLNLTIQPTITLSTFSALPWLTPVKLLLASLTAPVVFRLQKYGGPVMLSQIGYIAAGTGLLLAVLFLRESYSLTGWVSVGVIASGITLTLTAQMKGRQKPRTA